MSEYIRTDQGGGREARIPLDLPGNSNGSKRREESVKRVVTGRVRQRQTSVGRKVFETFAGNDMRSVGSGVLFDVIIPALKDLIFESGKEGLARSLYGGALRPNQMRPGSRIDYGGVTKKMTTRIVGGGASSRDRDIPQKARANHDFGDIILDSKGEAESALDALFDLVDTYELAAVSDLYEIVGLPWSYVDKKWGWQDLRGASTERTRDGYRLNLPKPIEIP